MIQVSVRLEIEKARSEFDAYQREVSLAASRAINRAADAGRAEGARQISTKTKLKISKVRRRMRTMNATPDRLYAEILGYPYSPNLAGFNAKRSKLGVIATAWEGSKVYLHSFITPRGQVVTRTTRARFPLKGLRGPSLPKTFMRDDVLRAMINRIYEVFPREFQRELERRIGV